MEGQLEFRGKKEERTLAQSVFELMVQQGMMYGADVPIRQSLHNLTDYFLQQKLRANREAVQELIEAALAKNEHIFAREERDGEVVYVTTRSGQPAQLPAESALPPRQLHRAPEDATPTPRRKAVHRPPMSPFWVRAAIRQLQPTRPTMPVTPVVSPISAVIEEEAPVVVVPPKKGPNTRLRLPNGASADLRESPEQVLTEHGAEISRVLKEALERDFRLVSFGDVWYLEDNIEHFSKGRLSEIRRYILEEETPLTDQMILTDLILKSQRDADYDLWAFSLDARLLREKKEFEYVGVRGANLWAVKGLPAIGSHLLKPAEIGQDYAFLQDEAAVVEKPAQIEHFLTFYEFQHGLLPYDAIAQAFFPQALLEEQRSAYLRFEVPQHYEAYAVELRFPVGNRGGWLWGLEEFFHNNLVPGAYVTIAPTDEPNLFVLQYMVTDEAQERRLLVFDERKNRYVFDDVSFYCGVEESLLLSEDRFPKLRNTPAMPPSARKRPADVVAHAFTLVGKKQGEQYEASVENIFPVVNIERPFSMAYLRQLLTEVDVFAPGDEEGVFIYTPGQEEE